MYVFLHNLLDPLYATGEARGAVNYNVRDMVFDDRWGLQLEPISYGNPI